LLLLLSVVNGLRLRARGRTLPAVTAHIVTCHLTLLDLRTQRGGRLS